MTAVAALPKADIHLHAETKARVDRLASRREGRKPYDWRANVESLSQVPAGIQRLEAISSAIEFPEVNQIARGSFVEWVSEAMHEAAREGAVLVEIRFGAGWVLWPDLMPKFREAELLTKTKYPGFCAEAVISGLSSLAPRRECTSGCVFGGSKGWVGWNRLHPDTLRAGSETGAVGRDLFLGREGGQRWPGYHCPRWRVLASQHPQGTGRSRSEPHWTCRSRCQRLCVLERDGQGAGNCGVLSDFECCPGSSCRHSRVIRYGPLLISAFQSHSTRTIQ